MVEATIEDLAITTLFGGGTASLSPFQRSPSGFTASPSRASPCDQRGIPPWNPQQRFSRRCCSSRETIWDHPHIVGEDVLSTIEIFTGTKPFLKANIKPFGITEIEILPFRRKRK
jgi:hypothetical protein